MAWQMISLSVLIMQVQTYIGRVAELGLESRVPGRCRQRYRHREWRFLRRCISLALSPESHKSRARCNTPPRCHPAAWQAGLASESWSGQSGINAKLDLWWISILFSGGENKSLNRTTKVTHSTLECEHVGLWKEYYPRIRLHLHVRSLPRHSSVNMCREALGNLWMDILVFAQRPESKSITSSWVVWKYAGRLCCHSIRMRWIADCSHCALNNAWASKIEGTSFLLCSKNQTWSSSDNVGLKSISYLSAFRIFETHNQWRQHENL